MKILLFGISCVGKSTVGKALGEKLNYPFYDLDEETVKFMGMTITRFIKKVKSLSERDEIREEIILDLINYREPNMVIAVTPMLYSDYINSIITYDDVIAIELQDSVENIFDRLIFTDNYGKVLPDSEEYKNKHKSYYLKDIKSDINFYKNSFVEIDNKLFLDGKTVDEVVQLIIETYLN